MAASRLGFWLAVLGRRAKPHKILTIKRMRITADKDDRKGLGNSSYAVRTNENTPPSDDDRVSYKKVAATYSTTWWGSTIGDGELNFSVRNGKRWILTAITATICF